MTQAVHADPPPTAQSNQSGEQIAQADLAGLESRIQEWITGLGSGEYATRRRAFLELWKQGSVALPAVRRALTTSDQQTVSAARVLENLLNLGLSPTDNDELAELLQLSESNWEETIHSLGQKGYWSMAADVLRSKPELVNGIRENYPVNRFSRLLQIAFEQGDAFQAWPVIAQGLSPERRFYLTELTRKHLRERYKDGLPEKIEQALDIVPAPDELPVDERALYLLYTGRTQAAWDLNPSPRVKQRIIFHTANWQWLQDPAVKALSLGASNNVHVERARAAAYCRFANDDAGYDEHIKWLREQLQPAEGQKPVTLPEAAKTELVRALIFCGEGSLVEKLYESNIKALDTEHLTTHFQHAAILEKFQLEPKLENFDEWLAELPGKLNPNGPQTIAGTNRVESYMDLVRFLTHTGKVKQAEELYRALFDSSRQLSGRDGWEKWSNLIARSEDHQIRRFLLKYLEDNDARLKPEERRISLVRLFPEWSNSVDKLWQLAPAELVKVDGHKSAWHLLERLWRYDRTLVSDEHGEKLIEKWLNDAIRASSKVEESADQSRSELATVALKLGMRRQALTITRAQTTSMTLADMAELLTVNNSLEAASKWWETGIAQLPDKHPWVRRYADVLLMQGERDLAERYEASIWLRPLGNRQLQNEDVPYGLAANNYFEAGEYDLAQQYSEVAVELSEPLELVYWVRRLTPIAIEREDYETAARSSRIYLLTLLASGSGPFRTQSDSLQFYEYFCGPRVAGQCRERDSSRSNRECSAKHRQV